MSYIGERSRSVSNRIREHMNDIKRFTPFYYKNVSKGVGETS